ncbi:MAG: GNAT family N-acetyltransferase [Chitinophagaceae bacterium]
MVAIINYDRSHQQDFKRLNKEWLDKYNLMETHDLEILDDPDGTVIAGGGVIFLATDKGKVVGTAGLWKENETDYELIKMAVDPVYQGQGISRILLDQCLAAARKRKAQKIFLYSNSQLTTALSLYEKYGFQYVPVTNAPFLTADVKMELPL